MQSTSPSQLRDLHWHTAVACLILRLFQLVMTERGRQTSITDLEARLASLQATERCLRQEITDIENSIRDSRAYYKAFRRLGRDTLRVARRYVECCRVVNDNSRSTRTRQAHAIERDTIVAQDGVDAEDLILLNNLDGWQPPHSKDAVTQWKAIIATKTTDLSRVTQAIFGCLQSIQNARRGCNLHGCAPQLTLFVGQRDRDLALGARLVPQLDNFRCRNRRSQSHRTHSRSPLSLVDLDAKVRGTITTQAVTIQTRSMGRIILKDSISWTKRATHITHDTAVARPLDLATIANR